MKFAVAAAALALLAGRGHAHVGVSLANVKLVQSKAEVVRTSVESTTLVRADRGWSTCPLRA